MLSALFYPKVPNNKYLFDTLYFPHILEEIHIKRVYNDFFTEYHKDMIVIDFGANCGLTTQYFREYAQKVYSVEPSPEHFEALKHNKEFNHWDNVEVFKLALSDSDGEAIFHINNTNRTASSLDNPFHTALATPGMHDFSNGDFKVKTITIETFFNQNKIDKVDFLKMDIEGQEDSIIVTEGFKKVLPNIKAMSIEFHNQEWEKLVAYIEGFGFKTKRSPVDTVSILFFK